jgi:hypothetical protein
MPSKRTPEPMSRDDALMCAFSTMEHAGQLNDSVLNETEAVLHNLHWFSAILGSDGFSGLFFGGLTDNYIEPIYSAVERFGAKQTAEIFTRALSIFPDRSRISDPDFRKEVWDGLTDADHDMLSGLSKEYSECHDITDSTLLDFIESNRNEIRFEVVLDKKRNKFRFVSHDKAIKLR